MLSTFSGLETMRRALFTNQVALQTVGHNIANANTPGYSRQRVNMTQTEAFPNPAFNKPGIPGQLGTGVRAGEIERVREAFLDLQFREENHKNGYWGARLDALEKMEDILNEPSESNIAKSMDQFWGSLQDLSVNPEDDGARSVVRQSGIALAETARASYEAIEAIQRDYQSQIKVQEDSMNSILRQINSLNLQIASVEPHGYLPNDLYDQRDLLVDELSGYINIGIEPVESGGMAKASAAGKYDIYLLDAQGKRMVDGSGDPIRLIDSSENKAYVISSNTATSSVTGKDAVRSIQITDPADATANVTVDFTDFSSRGKYQGTIESFGYIANPGDATADFVEAGIFSDMLKELDVMFSAFITEFNNVHSDNWSLSEINNNNTKVGIDFFSFDTTLNNSGGYFAGITKDFNISQAIRNSRDNIAAAGPTGQAFAGDGSGALLLSGVKDRTLDFGGNTTNVQSFYQSVIGEMAVDTREARRLENNTGLLRDSVDQNRKAVSSVSLDEEMSLMIQFQHAYNASARNLTAIDEMLDRIINGMGVVGR
ncbi:flagellar hook-associated protein FlgK [Paenalkalicoccus suaedae]|uniref:Flagellar hook-associated protein 1 n=1 Tax=Paenalkalicoccus suaedae TaxID=2592382 RepID=A0A859FHP7_9BACI|nr:flagellar hook-associated protein FlgK [Paenalkalicoccus suaedae]QKS72358.1 flagellar hook-associated protein FlgK [Paenalkalicoccus suaedae]